MNLIQKSQAVSALFEALDVETAAYHNRAALSCIIGCGKCCANPSVPATALEFLPMAMAAYHSGKAEELLDSIGENPEQSYCILLTTLSVDGSAGSCSQYKTRGLICRLFGSSAKKNKFGVKELITCKTLKEERAEEHLLTQKAISEGLAVPMSSHYYTQLYAIDPSMAGMQLPVNLAIKRALEEVLAFYFYSEGQAG
ncbi:hypothetical protein GCM10007049_10290 [Echinicola pacifica]|uniref:Zinc-or iron-chelating domain-containing protein n=1 Tax=Echinicola pacifica TaxID=346377 RepID=A0A918ULQ4_9BACT|nr:YkgJ family cysteine cluster protein [Echinicola pacifica]GGZ19718.1 hypothetical protein GCM10007049_10290 [Echinicola pacifica]